MPSLLLVRSPIQPPPFEEIELAASAEPRLIGRLPAQCQIVLQHLSVSKRHARLFADGGTVFIEDLKSRNKTYLNGQRLSPYIPKPLKPDDEIRICDFVLQYSADDHRVEVVVAQDVRVAPADRLQALLALGAGSHDTPDLGPLLNHVADMLFSTDLSKLLDLESLLNQIADTLLGVFKQAARCYLLLHDEGGRPHPRVTRCRPGAEGEGRFSRRIVQKVVEAMRSHLLVDTPGSGGAEPRSVMCVPLATSDVRAFGAIQIETRDRSETFDAADLGLLTVVANLAGVAVERVQLHAKAQVQAVVQSHMDLARQVQLDFLPRAVPAVGGYEFFTHYSPALTVGGDYYDFVPLPGGRVAVVLGDVAGEGVPAALLVAKLSSEVRFCLLSEPDPAKAVSLLNVQMSGSLRDRFVTMLVMVLDPASHRLTVVNAGHTIPKRHSAVGGKLGDLVGVESGGVPLGVEAGYNYSAITVALDPGDTVTAYTDGVTDAMDSAGATFGIGALEECLAASGSQGPDAARPRRVVEALTNAIRVHAAGRHPNDDIAIVCFGRWDSSSESSSTINGGPPSESGSGLPDA